MEQYKLDIVDIDKKKDSCRKVQDGNTLYKLVMRGM